MADTVKVTPASKKIEFFDANSTPFQGKISLDSNDNLVLESPNDIYLGDSSATLSIATDMLFSASKKIAASANNVDITIGDTSSLTGNDIIIDSHAWSVTSAGAATFSGGILGNTYMQGPLRVNFTGTAESTLHVEGDGIFTNTLHETTLDGAISAGATTITLTDASSFANSGYGALDNDDQFAWTGKSGNQLTGVSGVATTHADNVRVTHSTDATVLTLRCIGGPASALQSQLKLEADDYRGAGMRFESSGDDSTYTPWFAGRPYASQGFQIGYHATQPEYKANAVMYLETNGKVGIGNTAPGHLLEVTGDGANGEIVVNRASGAEIILQAQTSLGKLGTNTNHDLALMTNGSTRMHIENGGNVGINDTTPSYKLDVNGTGRFTNDLLGNNRIRCDRGDGEVEFNTTDGVFLITENVAVGGTPATPTISNTNQAITSVTTYGNCVRVSGTGGNTNFEPTGSGGAKVMLFAVVLHGDGSVADHFQSFDCTVYVGDDSHNYVHRKTIKCIYDGANTNLIYSYVDEMENFTTDMIDVKVDYTLGDSTLVSMTSGNINVARVYIEFGNLSGLSPTKISTNTLDWSWEFTGLKDEAHVG